MLVEHARNLIGIADATHAEYATHAEHRPPATPGTPVVTLLACSLPDNEIDVELRTDSVLARLHGTGRVRERTTCNYGLEPTMASIASKAGMIVAATDDTGEVRAVERPDHPFFLATLYVPQLSSAPHRPHPVFSGFVDAVRAAAAG